MKYNILIKFVNIQVYVVYSPSVIDPGGRRELSIKTLLKINGAFIGIFFRKLILLIVNVAIEVAFQNFYLRRIGKILIA